MPALLDLLAAGDPAAPAITAPGGLSLSYDAVRRQADRLGAQLAGAGIAPADRVGIILPNGPLMALTFLGVASHCGAAPLNPSYTDAEVLFYLEDLRAKALIVAPGAAAPRCPRASSSSSSPASPAELTLLRDGQPLPSPPPPRPPTTTSPFSLHTSGTTSRPKLVPLRSAISSPRARNIAATLQLSPDDRCLNIMPLFHIHGLIGGVARPPRRRRPVCCTPGFDAFRFFDWIMSARPPGIPPSPPCTSRSSPAPSATPNIASGQLRFIRSSSAALPPPVLPAHRGPLRRARSSRPTA